MLPAKTPPKENMARHGTIYAHAVLVTACFTGRGFWYPLQKISMHAVHVSSTVREHKNIKQINTDKGWILVKWG